MARAGKKRTVRSTEALRAQLRSLQVLLDAIPAPIFYKDAKGIYRGCNVAFERYLGLSREQIVGKSVYDISPKDLADIYYRADQALFDQPGVQTYETNVAYADGVRRDVTFYKATFLGPDGALGGLVGTILDITERKRAEALLRASEERYRGLIEGSIQGIVVQRDWIALFANSAFATMLGYASPAELIGLDMRRFIMSDHLRLVEGFAAARLRGEPAPPRYEIQMVRKDGTPLWVEIQPSVVSWEGAPAIIGTLVDVTERRRAEATVRQQEQQLQRSQRIEAIGRLAGGIAHEFNNLLTVIIGRTELLTGVLPVSHSGSDNLALIAKAGERAATLTRQLLAFSRKQVLQQRVVDLNRVVAGMVDLLRPLVGETLELVTALDRQPVVVKGDPTQIEQVIMNLVLNSRDATPRGGRITIATQREDPRGVLEVSDTGCGMSAEVQAHLFEPFFTTKAVGKGNGLGLATVYGIVKQHEGDIAVMSVPSQGTAVRVYLPLLPDAVELEEIERPRPFAGGSARILLVEDEPAVRDLAQEALARCGYRVLAAATPAEAQALAEQHHGRINLLLTDVIMPELSGPELADRLTRGQRDMRVLYMSGYTDDVLADHGVPGAGAAFLAKPFTPEALSRAVQDTLEGPLPPETGRDIADQTRREAAHGGIHPEA
jgi:two-component system cell cycle sensor histidine kinase/response regulator CckA